ncbi:hypothetical protein CQW23_10111 [Capsicum baccatum]|uniref:Uncharacterized protein n=1 Tax=Capsicum baccatum TaxID=33114 RepID=A0A2G2WYP1_CAPBA|nr:hypothetical protein CQW23_10111 [Capsicum baccatum]
MRVLVHFSSQVGMNGFIVKSVFPETKPTLFLRRGDSIPTDQVNFHFLRGGTPEEVSLDLILHCVGLLGKLNVLYDMVGDATKGSFGEGCSTSHIKHFGFSSCKFIMHVFNDVLKVCMLGFGFQDGEPKVNFKDHIPNSALHLREVSYEFLNNDGIIRGPPIEKEAGLARPYDVGQESFWNQENESFVHLRVHCVVLKHFFVEGNGFMGFERLDILKYFRVPKGLIQSGVSFVAECRSRMIFLKVLKVMAGGEIVGVLDSFNSSKKQSHFLEDVPTSFRVPLGSQGLQLLDGDRVLAMKWEHGLERVESLPGRGSGVGVELMEVTFAEKSIEEGLCKFPMIDGLFSWEMKGFALKLALGEDFPYFGGVPVWAHLLGKVIYEGYYCVWGLEDPAYLLRQLGSKGLRFWLNAKVGAYLLEGHLRSYPFSGDRFHLKVTVFQGSASSKFGFTSCDIGGVGEAFGWLDWTWKLLFVDAFLLRLCEEDGFFGTGSRLPKASTWEQMVPKKLPSPSSAPSKGTNSVTTSSISAKINRKLPSDDGKENGQVSRDGNAPIVEIVFISNEPNNLKTVRGKGVPGKSTVEGFAFELLPLKDGQVSRYGTAPIVEIFFISIEPNDPKTLRGACPSISIAILVFSSKDSTPQAGGMSRKSSGQANMEGSIPDLTFMES